MGEGAFYNVDQLLALGEERRNGQKYRDNANGATLKGLVAVLLVIKKRLTLLAKKTVA